VSAQALFPEVVTAQDVSLGWIIRRLKAKVNERNFLGRKTNKADGGAADRKDKTRISKHLPECARLGAAEEAAF